MAMNDASVSEPARREFVYTRVVNAPRKLVWETYTEPRHLKHWWGPPGMPITVDQFDLRPGGTFLYSMRLPQDQRMYGKFVYREISAIDRLSFVVSFCDAEGTPTRHPMSATWPLEVFTCIDFTEADGKTTIHMTGYPINASAEECETFAGAGDGMRKGNDGSMAQLEKYMESLIAGIEDPVAPVGLEATDLAFVLTRVFDAPRELVYKVWTEPAHFAKWWGPHTFSTPEVVMELHVGGAFKAVMRSPEGVDHPLVGEFREVVPQQKLVFMMDTNGHPPAWRAIVNKARGAAPDAPTPNPLTTVIFEDLGGKTKLTIEQRFENAVDRDAFIALGTREGWGQSFVKMDSLLATLATEREVIIKRTLNAPRALVWQVWSNPDHLAKWWGPNGFTNTVHSFDMRVGGEWLYTMHGPDGTDYPNWIRFDEVTEPSHLAYTHGDMKDDPNAFHAAVSFEEVVGGKTHVKLHIRVASAAVRAGMFEFGAFEGGDQTLARLDAFLQTI